MEAFATLGEVPGRSGQRPAGLLNGLYLKLAA